jgi:hypothetical protein
VKKITSRTVRQSNLVGTDHHDFCSLDQGDCHLAFLEPRFPDWKHVNPERAGYFVMLGYRDGDRDTSMVTNEAILNEADSPVNWSPQRITALVV